MNQNFASLPVLAAFLLASFVLAVTPGPGVVYIVARTLAQGRRAGLASVAGVALGNLGNAAGASIGLAALFSLSLLAFTVVKFAGAAYLVYLGIQTLRRSAPDSQVANLQPAPVSHIFRDGFFVALLNPKTALFFAAFLPQFMNPSASAVLQSVALGATFVLIAACTDSAYVFAAMAAAPALGRLKTGRQWGRYATALALIGLGAYTAVAGSRAAR
jgi:threonine/homoserine/homoserine lactone efflux protein